MLLCMRTTIRLDDSLFRDVKKAAAESGQTLTAVIEDALREKLARRKRAKTGALPAFSTFRGEGLQPGVDLDDSASLLDRMEGRD